jgi:NADH-quinone oxidoreductase subunit N
MNLAQLTALTPLVILSVSLVVIMVTIAFHRNHLLTLVLTLIALGLSFISIPLVVGVLPEQVTLLLTIDQYSAFFFGLIILSSFAVALLSYGYFEEHLAAPEEFYVLLLLATLGSCILAASSHFVSFFVGLEILSVSLYTMIAYIRPEERSVEAGLKYLVLAAVSAAFLLFGMALVYAQTGTMGFTELALSEPLKNSVGNIILIAGYGLITVGIGFKLALVPFHLWTPDIYEGAPAPVAAFVATISKGAMFALLLRYFSSVEYHLVHSLVIIFTAIAIASILIGNLLGLLQNNVKRLLAYSSIAHLGYLLVAFLASGLLVPTAVAFYLVAYFATTIGAFGIITVLSTRGHETGDIEEFRGMFWWHPWLTTFFSVMLFSLAGIPLTAGFVGKFYVVLAGIGSSLWLPVAVLVVGSAIGLFYYLRVIVVMYSPLSGHPQEGSRVARISTAGGMVLVVLTVFIIWMGIYPTQVIRLLMATVGKLIVH